MPRNLLKASSKTEDSAPGPKPLKVKEEGSNVYNTVASVCDCGFGHAVRAEAVVMRSKKDNINFIILEVFVKGASWRTFEDTKSEFLLVYLCVHVKTEGMVH
jgi:hypothetical protein